MRREQFYSLFQNISQELIRTFFPYTKKVTTDKMLDRDFMLLSCTRQPRICHNSRKHVGREFNFRNNLHITYLSILYQLLYILLGIITTKTMSVFTGSRAYLGKPWIFLDFKSPSRIINHVELKLVQFIHIRTPCRKNIVPHQASYLATDAPEHH